MSRGYIKSLDGLRALAIILVMTFHAGLTHFGWMGVQLFFVLSGFLITGILWKEKGTKRSRSFQLRKFWYRRSLRIFPLYFGYLLFFGLTYLLFHFPAYYPTYFPYLISYTVNFSRTLPQWQGNPLFTHLWSLSIEEQFYLFFPLLIFFTRPSLIRFLMAAIVLAAPLIRYGIGLYYEGRGYGPETVADIVYWNTLSHLDAFFMGGMIPVFGLEQKVKRPRLFLFLAALAAAAAGVWNFSSGPAEHSYLTDLGYGHGQAGNGQHIWQYTLLNSVFALTILNLISPRSGNLGATKLLEHPWLVQIGRVSYGMYLFHWALLVYVFAPLFAIKNEAVRWLGFLPYLLAVYGFAYMSFRLFESRFLRLKDVFFNTEKERVLPPASS